MRLTDNNPREDFMSSQIRLPPVLVWAGIWLALFLLFPFLMEIVAALRLPRHGTVSPLHFDLARLALPLALMVSVLTFILWRSQQQPQVRRPNSSPPMSPGTSAFRVTALIAFSIVLKLSPLVFLPHSALHPDWAQLAFCMVGFYAVVYFLIWWTQNQLPPRQWIADPLSLDTSGEASEPFMSWPPSANSAVSLQNIKGLFLAKDTGQELTFRLPAASRGCLFLLALFFGTLSVVSIVLFSDILSYASRVPFILLLAFLLFGFLTFVLLSGSGPNTLVLNLEGRTYSHTMYAPLPIRKYAKLGLGIPFWVKPVMGPMSEIAGICVKETVGKNATVYRTHVVWNDPYRPPAYLSRSYQAEEARLQMLALTERIGVPALGRCID